MHRIIIVLFSLANYISLAAQPPVTPDDINQYYGAKWNGLIPHFQPFNTTDYYGSGDLNLNEIVDQEDINELRKILSGQINPNIRADVNGDNEINSSDEELLFTAVNGNALPSWWNVNQSKDDKINWLKKMLRIDKTDEKVYIPDQFECAGFATELYKNFTGYNVFSDYSSQTIYNLPVYYVLITPPSGTSHNLNAILTGDDPHNYSDWIFIEPQTDEFVSLNNYSSGTEISIMPLQSFPLLVFTRTASGYELKYCSGSLLRYRPGVQPDIQNIVYTWYPALIPNNRILFEKAADDLSRIFKIHITNSDSLSILAGKPLAINQNKTHRIISKLNRNGNTDLIWQETKGDSVRYYFSSIERGSNELKNTQELAFFADNNFNGLDMYITGVHGFIFWRCAPAEDANKLFYSEMKEGKWQERKYIEMSKSDYPLFDYEPGVDESGKFHLFTTIKTSVWWKLVIYSFDEGWRESHRIDYVLGSHLFFAGNKFFLSETRIANKASDIAVYSRQKESWKVEYNVFYGIPMEFVESGIPERPVYILGISKYEENYILELAYINSDCYISGYQTFHDFSVSNKVTGIIENSILKAAWQNNGEIQFMNYNLALTGIAGILKEVNPIMLSQNFPNPFNSSTKFHFSVITPGEVRLIIFDILGREVSTVFNEWKDAGNYSVSFDAGNLESGVYLYQLITSNAIFTRKMILIK